MTFTLAIFLDLFVLYLRTWHLIEIEIVDQETGEVLDLVPLSVVDQVLEVEIVIEETRLASRLRRRYARAERAVDL
ncbi:hypothetical protein A2111_03400 [Candidatus Daviesbacteria bacterium GWA1_38_6]|nr:MAG: hypothetical protein A2111_03400 [Candidatus Daviesbacteria bacterium GWA1_38_6]